MFQLRKAAVAAVAVTALALAGCAGTKSDESASENDVLSLLRTEAAASLQKAADNTQKSKSVAFTMVMKTQGTTVNGSGAISYGSPLAMSMTMEMPQLGSMEVRLVDGVQYIKMPPQLQQNLGGKPWLRINLADAAEAAGIGADQLTKQLEQADPAKQIKNLLDGGKLKVVGEETVDGAKTVHYSGTLTLEDYLARTAAGDRAQLKEQLEKASVTEIVTDFWIDEKYQPRKMQLKMGLVDVASTYTDYGKPVTVTAPPAAETSDFAELRKKAGA